MTNRVAVEETLPVMLALLYYQLCMNCVPCGVFPIVPVKSAQAYNALDEMPREIGKLKCLEFRKFHFYEFIRLGSHCF